MNVTYKVKDAAGMYSTTRVYEPDSEQVRRFAQAQVAAMVSELAAEGVDVLMVTMYLNVSADVLVALPTVPVVEATAQEVAR